MKPKDSAAFGGRLRLNAKNGPYYVEALRTQIQMVEWNLGGCPSPPGFTVA